MFEQTSMLVLKVTRDCNLRCKYCYVKNKDNFKGEIISFEVFKKIIDKVIKDKKKPEAIDDISIVFHGGEPLIIGYEKLSLFFSYIKRAFEENNLNYSLGVQTNTTLLTEDILSLLHDYNVNVGVSFDGKDKSNSARTNMDTENFVKKFKDMDDFGVPFGVLMVISQANASDILENMDYIKNVLKRNDIKVNYAEDTLSVGDSELSGKEYFEKVVKKILDALVNRELPIGESNIQHFFKNYLLRYLIGKNSFEIFKSSCNSKFCGGGIKVIEASPDGTFHLCGRYSEDFDIALIGDVFTKDFLNLKRTKKLLEVVVAKNNSIKKLGCDTCIADDICDHGCVAFHYNKYGSWGIREDLVCDLYKSMKKYFIKNDKKIFESLYEKNKNNEGIWYIDFGINIDENMLKNIRRKLGDNYEINHDKKFISKNKTYNPQIQVERKK